MPQPLVPNRFLFRFEFPIYRCAKTPKLDGSVDAWDARYALPPLHRLDEESGFAAVYATWNEDGLYIACEVGGKSHPPRCEPGRLGNSDGLRLLTDMRDSRDVRRATRFCQQFFFLPTGDGPRRDRPIAGSTPIQRAQDDAPHVRPSDLPIASRRTPTGYSLTAHLPRRVLSGFDPAENPRIGFYYVVEDDELGRQTLTVGSDLNALIDPSTWATAILTSV